MADNPWPADATRSQLPDDATRTTGGPPDGTRTADAAGSDTADDVDATALLAPPGRPGSLGRLGHYEVLEVLGRGGFGVVYRGFDDKLQRVVAVKVLAPHLSAHGPARQRFLREARSAAGVKHPNVVQVYAVEEQPLPHLVMEYLPGPTLQQRLDRDGPLPLPELLRVGRQLADGLAAAHATGLVHRDIKPSNVLLDTGPQPAVRITDFGLARAADDTSLTRTGTVAGTPLYMSPEQARGETLDPRSDLFSLGSVLYALATARPPFAAGSTLAVLKRVAEDDPPPVRQVRPDLPAWFARIVEKLHAKDPAERFQTAREVADLLGDCERQLAESNKLTDTSRIPAAKPRAKRKGVPAWVWVVVAVFGGLLAVGCVAPLVLALGWLTVRPVSSPADAPAEVPEPVATPSDADRLLGEWVVVSSESNGQVVTAKVGEGPTFRFGEKDVIVSIGAHRESVTYRLDPARGELLFQGPMEASLLPIGYRFDGDRLRLTPPAGVFGDLIQTDRDRSLNNLKSFGIALHNYSSALGYLPPAGSPAPTGNNLTPLLSWRVAILPYIEQEQLYRQFHHDEPWDSEHNKKLIAKMPKEFAVPGLDAPPGQTHYQTFTGPGTMFEPTKDPRKGVRLIQDTLDGTANTLLIVEAAEPVVWTKPADLPFDPKKPMPKLRVADGRVSVGFADGSVQILDGPLKDDTLQALITRNGGEDVKAWELDANKKAQGGPVVLECVRKPAAPAGGK